MRERHRDALRRLAQAEPAPGSSVGAPASVLEEAVWRAATVPVERATRARLIVTAVAVAAVAVAALLLTSRVAGGVPRSHAVTQYAFTATGSPPRRAPALHAGRARADRHAAGFAPARASSAPESPAPATSAPVVPAATAGPARPAEPRKLSSAVVTMSPGGTAVASAPSRGGVLATSGAGSQNQTPAPTVTVTKPVPHHHRSKHHHRDD